MEYFGLIGLSLILVGSAFFFFIIRISLHNRLGLYRIKNGRKWPCVTGTLIETSEIIKINAGTLCEFKYKYNVGGINYTGESVSSSSEVDKLKKMKHFSLWHDPDDPKIASYAAIRRPSYSEASQWGFFFISLGFVFLVLYKSKY
jgi:hypothetical protein